MKNKKNVLLLTATIQPRPPFSSLKRSNPEIRLKDYCEALSKWATIKSPYFDEIVFCDNSGFSLESIKKIFSIHYNYKPVEFISFTEAAPPPGVHYGYTELLLVRYALAHSKFLKQANYFMKATGRLYFPKINQLLSRISADSKAVVDCRGIHLHEVGLPIRARTQLMYFEKQFYFEAVDRLLDNMPLRRDSHIEEFIAYCLLKRSCENENSQIQYRFPVNCNPSGVSGNGFKYDSIKAQVKGASTAICRKFFPSLYA